MKFFSHQSVVGQYGTTRTLSCRTELQFSTVSLQSPQATPTLYHLQLTVMLGPFLASLNGVSAFRGLLAYRRCSGGRLEGAGSEVKMRRAWLICKKVEED